jgi:DNA-binding response OmpR family regulator
MKEDRERRLSAGMDAYVTKPIRPAELFSVIQSVLQSSAAQNGSTLLTPVPSPTSVFVRPLPFAEFRENKKISQRRACEWRLVRPEYLTSRFELLGMGTASRPCEFCH